MATDDIYFRILGLPNLALAWKKARKHKTKKDYVKDFELDLAENLISLHYQLKNQTYQPMPLKHFVLRDPKTRKISKSAFRDRIIHHALVMVIEPFFEKTFIYDSCANRKGKGNLFAVERFDKFMRKVSRNGKMKGWFNSNQIQGFCLKADIKHYFEEVNHGILINLLRRKIKDEKTILLVKKILGNVGGGRSRKRNASGKLNVTVLRECLSA